MKKSEHIIESYLALELKKLREIRGLSQNAVAKEVFISRSSISAYETGKTIPRYPELEKLAELYKVPIEDFLTLLPSRANTSSPFLIELKGYDYLINSPDKVKKYKTLGHGEILWLNLYEKTDPNLRAFVMDITQRIIYFFENIS